MVQPRGDQFQSQPLQSQPMGTMQPAATSAPPSAVGWQPEGSGAQGGVASGSPAAGSSSPLHGMQGSSGALASLAPASASPNDAQAAALLDLPQLSPPGPEEITQVAKNIDALRAQLLQLGVQPCV